VAWLDTGVVEVGATWGTGVAEVIDIAWGAVEVVGAAREAAEVGEAGDGAAAQGDRLRWRSDRQPLFHERSDSLGSRSDCQPLFRGRSDRLGLRSDCQSLFRAWSNRPDVRSGRQQRPAAESPVERGASVVVRAWEPHRESHPAERCLNR
jgi:hypothetical protein